MEPREQIEISASELSYILTLAMVCDPYPDNIDSDKLADFLNRVSQQFGYMDWADAYNKIVPAQTESKNESAADPAATENR